MYIPEDFDSDINYADRVNLSKKIYLPGLILSLRNAVTQKIYSVFVLPLIISVTLLDSVFKI